MAACIIGAVSLLRRPGRRDDVFGGEPPIFVHGISRAGGTLVTTILDAHPQVAMSYELYPQLLEGADADALTRRFGKASSVRSAAGKLEPDAKTFFLRAERSGLEPGEIAGALRGGDLSSAKGRVTFVARLARAKMRKLGKSRWGVKCGSDYDDYVALWPGALFVGLLRDGRDVLASQQKTGSFDRDPAHIADAWAEDVARFQALLDDPSVHALQVRYEELVADPEPQIARLASFVGVDLDPKMLRHHEEALTVFDAHHLSMDRITLPIDASQVGRWTRDVSRDDLDVFWSHAGRAMEAAGYAAG